MARTKAQQVKHLSDWEVLRHFRPDGYAAQTWEELLAAGWHPSVVWRKLEQLDRRDLIEWGVSLRRCWLSESGRELYDQLRPQVPE